MLNLYSKRTSTLNENFDILKFVPFNKMGEMGWSTNSQYGYCLGWVEAGRVRLG